MSQETPESSRIQSIDILRGAVMVLMAIDHVRVYSGVTPGGPDVGVFFTRWVTNFCAPVFVFLTGTGAFFYGRKLGNPAALGRYLLTRGLLLVVLELTVIRFFWTFNLNFSDFTLLGVIWMLGWCMVMLAGMVRLRPKTIGIIGIAMISLQQLFKLVPMALPDSLKPTVGGFWEFFYSSGLEPLPGVAILYVLLPWIGVMAAGYWFGEILIMDPEKRANWCSKIGLTAIITFIIAGSVMVVAKDAAPDAPPFIFRLLNQQKYPPSQLFLLMTLGPAILLTPLAERARGKVAAVLTVFGRVPFFYYLLHILLIHVSAIIVNLIRAGVTHQEWYGRAPFVHVEEELRWSLPLLYLLFFIDVFILYFICRWYMRYKFTHPEKNWLKYI